MNARSNAASIIFQNVCKQRSKAHAAPTVRVLKRTWIAHASSQTISIHCVAVLMKERSRVNAVGKVSSKVKVDKANVDSKASRSKASRVRVRARVKAANRVSRARTVSKDSKGSAVRRANRDNK